MAAPYGSLCFWGDHTGSPLLAYGCAIRHAVFFGANTRGRPCSPMAAPYGSLCAIPELPACAPDGSFHTVRGSSGDDDRL